MTDRGDESPLKRSRTAPGYCNVLLRIFRDAISASRQTLSVENKT